MFEDLSAQFGRENVFMDVAGIKKGLDFRRIIDEAVSSCGVLLVLIGKNWLAAADDQGQRRLDDAGDFVRLETAAALKRGIPVIPVLVQGARMPREADLPESLKELAYRNGTELTHARWESDVKLLIDDLKHCVEEPAVPPSASPAPAPAPAAMQPLAAAVARSPADGRRWVPIAAAVALVVAAGFGYSTWQSRQAALEAVRVTKDQAEAERRARDAEVALQKAIAEKAAVEKATAERAAAEKAAAEKATAAKTTAERAAADELARKRAASVGSCIAGYVWRDAGANDRVCVTPASRTQAAADNQQAAARRQPSGGAYGANTCRQGYVWREAFAGDLVCVTPEARARSADENAKAASRVVR